MRRFEYLGDYVRAVCFGSRGLLTTLLNLGGLVFGLTVISVIALTSELDPASAALAVGVGLALLVITHYGPFVAYQEQRKARQALEAKLNGPQPNIRIERDIKGDWLYLKITNAGPTASFTGQVIESKGDDEMTGLWLMKWRQQGREVQIVSGTSYLLELAEATQRDCRSDDDKYSSCLLFCYVSLTARFDSPLWVRHNWGENSEVLNRVADADVRRLVSLRVQIASGSPQWLAEAWVHLGFELGDGPYDSIPTMEIDGIKQGAQLSDQQIA